MSAGPRVLLLTLSERTSGKGNRYLSGWLGKASVVAFAGEPDKHGNPTWDLFVSEPQPRAEAGQERPQARPERRPQSPDPGDVGRPVAETGSLPIGPASHAKLRRRPAKPSAPPAGRGDGWRGSRVPPARERRQAGPCGRRRGLRRGHSRGPVPVSTPAGRAAARHRRAGAARGAGDKAAHALAEAEERGRGRPGRGRRGRGGLGCATDGRGRRGGRPRPVPEIEAQLSRPRRRGHAS